MDHGRHSPSQLSNIFSLSFKILDYHAFESTVRGIIRLLSIPDQPVIVTIAVKATILLPVSTLRLLSFHHTPFTACASLTGSFSIPYPFKLLCKSKPPEVCLEPLNVSNQTTKGP